METIHTIKTPDGTSYNIRLNEDGSLPLIDKKIYSMIVKENPLMQMELLGGGVKPVIYNGKVVSNLGYGVTLKDGYIRFSTKGVRGNMTTDRLLYAILKINPSSRIKVSPGYMYMNRTFKAHDGGVRRAHREFLLGIYPDNNKKLFDIDSNTGNGIFFKYPNSNTYYFLYYKAISTKESVMGIDVTLIVDRNVPIRVRYTYKDNKLNIINTVTYTLRGLFELISREPTPQYSISITHGDNVDSPLVYGFFHEDAIMNTNDHTVLMVEILGYVDE